MSTFFDPEFDKLFQFPFHRDRLCNPPVVRAHHPLTGRRCFNSLFIGIGSAMTGCTGIEPVRQTVFQFPFHRDRLCNVGSIPVMLSWESLLFQFPFHRDRLCNCGLVSLVVVVYRMFQFPFHRDRLCNIHLYPNTFSNSRFQFPFHRDRLCNWHRTGDVATGLGFVSIPFSSG